MTEWLHFHFSLSCIGEGNGNPLQCSCLENPRMGKPGGLPSMGSHRVGHDWSNLATAATAGENSLPGFMPSQIIISQAKKKRGNPFLRCVCVCVCMCVCVHVCVGVSQSVLSNSVTLWTIAHQAPLSMEFSRQDYWGFLLYPVLIFDPQKWWT